MGFMAEIPQRQPGIPLFQDIVLVEDLPGTTYFKRRSGLRRLQDTVSTSSDALLPDSPAPSGQLTPRGILSPQEWPEGRKPPAGATGIGEPDHPPISLLIFCILASRPSVLLLCVSLYTESRNLLALSDPGFLRM